MNNKLNLKGLKMPLLVVALVAFTLVGVVLARSITKTNVDRVYLEKDIPKANLTHKIDFSIEAEQDEDAPFKIIDAQVSVIPADEYEELTSEKADFGEVVSVPKVTLKNVSDKTVTGISLIVADKAANTKQGFYVREQSIKPGQEFVFSAENIVPLGDNPAKNPKFWLKNAADKSKVTVRVVAFFEDGTMWANKNQRY